jgi:hypothetical protein
VKCLDCGHPILILSGDDFDDSAYMEGDIPSQQWQRTRKRFHFFTQMVEFGSHLQNSFLMRPFVFASSSLPSVGLRDDLGESGFRS